MTEELRVRTYRTHWEAMKLAADVPADKAAKARQGARGRRG